MIDRGFIKWQPFNSVIQTKVLLNNLLNQKEVEKPTLFPEKIEMLNEKIREAYYAQNKIIITFYEKNQIKNITTTIKKINTNTKTIELDNHKIITFSQILNINEY